MTLTPYGRRRRRTRTWRERCASWPAPGRRAAGAQLPAAGDPGHRRPHRRLAGAVAGSRPSQRRVDDRVLRRALHGRDREDPRPGQDGADPGRRAGCSLADSINADQLRAWKAEHPGAVVVSYVNTTAAVKAETDICCTSSNAVEVVASIPADREVLFLPDQFLGAHVRRDDRAGEHARLGGGVPRARRHQRRRARPRRSPRTRTPSCSSTPSAAAPPRRCTWRGDGRGAAERVKILSTGGMLDAARATTAKSVLVATEVGMLHQLRRAAPEIDFRAVNDRASCRYMKMITPDEAAALAARGPRRGARRPRAGRRAAGAPCSA